MAARSGPEDTLEKALTFGTHPLAEVQELYMAKVQLKYHLGV